MTWNVNVQVDAEDSFGVLKILQPLQTIQGVKVGSITVQGGVNMGQQFQKTTMQPTPQIPVPQPKVA